LRQRVFERGLRTGTVLTLLLLLVGAVVANHYSYGAAQEQPRYGGTLVLGQAGDPPMIIPFHAFLLGSSCTGLVYQALVMADFDMKMIPTLAESWQISADGKTYTFKLRSGILWNDGKPFTSADVKFSMEEGTLKLHPNRSALAMIDKIEAPDQGTVVFTLKYPFAPFLKALAFYGAIIPKHIFEGTDILQNPRGWDNPVGTGPFMLKTSVKGSHWEFVRNPRYFKKGQPYLDRVIVKVIPDASVRTLALVKGEANYLPITLPLHEVDRVNKTEGARVTFSGSEASQIHVMLGLNLRRPPFNDVRVRQALAYALDKDAILKKASFGYGRVSKSLFTSEMWGFNPNLPPYAYSVAKANSLLDEAGFKRGSDGTRFKVGIINPGYVDVLSWTSEVVRDQLKEVGIGVEVKIMEYGAFLEAVNYNWDFDIHIHRFPLGFGDPALLEGWFHSKSIYKTRAHGNNEFGYNNSRIDSLIGAVVAEMDDKKRLQYCYEMQEILWKELPAVPLFEAVSASGYQTDFVGLPLGPTQARGMIDSVWWRKGSLVSPESALQSIKLAEDELAKSKDMPLTNPSGAAAKIAEAKKAYEVGDYATSQKLAGEAVALATPPYSTYAAIAVMAIAVVVVAVLYLRRRKLGK